MIHVYDNDRGIPAKMQARLCRPFSATKRGGTGLGLAISDRIIDPHRDSLTCVSKSPGAQPGTTFAIKIPITPLQQKQSSG
jgi:two-component system sensor histidine kinase AtoS